MRILLRFQMNLLASIPDIPINLKSTCSIFGQHLPHSGHRRHRL